MENNTKNNEEEYFNIVRQFSNGRTRVLFKGVTQYHVDKWCSRDNASSKTCTCKLGKERTRKHGPWEDVPVPSTYKIERVFKGHGEPLQGWSSERKTIKKGLTLKQAQTWCRDPETSSDTCTSKAGKERTRRKGRWMDTYKLEK